MKSNKIKGKKKTVHNLVGCRCPEGVDIRFCLGERPTNLNHKEYMKTKKGEKNKLKEIKIIYFISCVWCGKLIQQDEWNEHPRNCIFYQEYLRQLI